MIALGFMDKVRAEFQAYPGSCDHVGSNQGPSLTPLCPPLSLSLLSSK